GMARDYREAKVLDQIEPGKRYLIRFCHGLGDMVMFLPLWRALQELRPESRIDLQLFNGQEGLFGSVHNPDPKDYDDVFDIAFLCAEGSGWTKAWRCCVHELGIPPIQPLASLPLCDSPLVAVHFQGTSLPLATNCPEAVAAMIWAEVGSAGKMPFEVHYLHCWANPANRPYACVTNSARHAAVPAITIPNLIGLLQRCFAFVGVLSGPAMAALALAPARCLILENRTRLAYYTPTPAATLDVNAYKPGSVAAWLKSL
nr:hypothetical protein [Candidatus Brocadiia bacterium]